MSYQVHGGDLPLWEYAVWIDGKPQPSDVARWGGKEAPPAIGAAITVKMNSLGPAVVTGYFTEHGWLGILCRLHEPPEWLLKQNNGDRTGHIFGPEFVAA